MIYAETEGLAVTLIIAIIILGVLIGIASIVALIFSIYLAIKYIKYNRQKAKCGIAGKDVARQLLDKNDLGHIKVVRASFIAAFTVGNSYSHYFKRVRLRGLIYKKDSLTSVAIAGEKVGLALLDKEQDPDMVKRIRLLPIITFGPFFFIFLVLIGLLLDFLFFNADGTVFLILSVIAVLFYVWTFILSIRTLRSEKKAQDRAIEILRQDNYLTEDEVQDAKDLYHLYNINYILDAVIAFLEALRKILMLVLKIMAKVNKSNN